MFPYDPDLLTIVSNTPQTVDDVLATMQTIADTCVDGDGLKWFNWLYHSVTLAVADKIRTGDFENPQWMAGLDVQFARLYFGALRTMLQGQKPPSCWLAFFSRRTDARLVRFQFAMSGINAHINHDLAIALVNTFHAGECAPDRDDPRYRDYTGLNATLESMIDMAKRELNVRLLGEVLPPLARLEDTVAAFGVVAAREAAWRNCEVLWHLQESPQLAGAFLKSLDGLSTVAGKALLVAPV